MLKTVGIVLVILGAVGTGGSMALSLRHAVTVTRQLVAALEQMKNEIAYRRTALPELMRILSVGRDGPVGELFGRMADELALRQAASVYAIMRRCLGQSPAFPPPLRRVLLELAGGLGQYDLDGQTRAIDLALSETRALLVQYEADQRAHARSCWTLGLCAGLAIAILAL